MAEGASETDLMPDHEVVLAADAEPLRRVGGDQRARAAYKRLGLELGDLI